jgi:hypothetical protein
MSFLLREMENRKGSSSTTEIVSKIKELNSVKLELARLKIVKKDLDVKRKLLELDIQEFLEDNEQPGLRCGDTVIFIKESTIRKSNYRKKDEKLRFFKDFLEDKGFNVDDDTIKEMFDSLKGSPRKSKTLRLKHDPISIDDIAED